MLFSTCAVLLVLLLFGSNAHVIIDTIWYGIVIMYVLAHMFAKYLFVQDDQVATNNVNNATSIVTSPVTPPPQQQYVQMIERQHNSNHKRSQSESCLIPRSQVQTEIARKKSQYQILRSQSRSANTEKQTCEQATQSWELEWNDSVDDLFSPLTVELTEEPLQLQEQEVAQHLDFEKDLDSAPASILAMEHAMQMEEEHELDPKEQTSETVQEMEPQQQIADMQIVPEEAAPSIPLPQEKAPVLQAQTEQVESTIANIILPQPVEPIEKQKQLQSVQPQDVSPLLVPEQVIVHHLNDSQDLNISDDETESVTSTASEPLLELMPMDPTREEETDVVTPMIEEPMLPKSELIVLHTEREASPISMDPPLLDIPIEASLELQKHEQQAVAQPIQLPEQQQPNELPAHIDPREQKQLRIIQELVETEQSYVDNLATLSQFYISALKQNVDILAPMQMKKIFGEVEVILGLNQQFLEQLVDIITVHNATSIDHVTRVANLFLTYSEAFKLYTGYIGNYKHAADAYLQERKKNDKFKQFCDTTAKHLILMSHSSVQTDVLAYLITPIQRIRTSFQIVSNHV